MATLGIKLQNGTLAEAPVEEWVAALLALMPDSQRAAVVEKLEQNTRRGTWTAAGRAIARPGRGYVLEAEPGVIGLSRG